MGGVLHAHPEERTPLFVPHPDRQRVPALRIDGRIDGPLHSSELRPFISEPLRSFPGEPDLSILGR